MSKWLLGTRVVYCVFLVFGEVGQVVWLPLWLDSVDLTNYWNEKNLSTPNRLVFAPSPGSASYSIVAVTAVIQVLILLTICSALRLHRKTSCNYTFVGTAVSYFIYNTLTPYVSSSSRNSPIIQALLLNAYTPLTMVVRLFMLKIIPSLKKCACVFIVMVGLGLATIPDIFPNYFDAIREKKSIGPIYQSKTKAILWIFAYIFFSVLPDIFIYTLCEKMVRTSRIEAPLQITHYHANKAEVQIIDSTPIHRPALFLRNINQDILNFLSPLYTFNLIATFSCFWIDLIPSFGYSTNITGFFEIIYVSTLCSLGKFGCSPYTPGFAVGYCASILLSNYCSAGLMCAGDGSTFVAILMNMVTPLAVIFWLLFEAHPLPFRWRPHFEESKWFPITAMLLIVPAVIAYNLCDDDHAFTWEWHQNHALNIAYPTLKILKKLSLHPEIPN